MNRQEVFQWVKKQYGTEPDYPWNDENAVLRHKENSKWYAVILKVNKSKLGLMDESLVDVINVKCDPLLVGSLQMKSGFHPAYHMNKEKWISIRLDDSVKKEEIKSLIHLSYTLTCPRPAKKKETKKLL